MCRLTIDKVVKKILFPQDVALSTSYLNDVRFDQRRGSEGMAFITDSAQKGPNGIIVVDLASDTSWRRLHDHPSTKSEELQTFLPIVEGRPFLEDEPDGSVKQGAGMVSDGIAISADGARLYYCLLGSRKFYSVDTDALVNRSLDEQQVAATVTDQGDRGAPLMGLNRTQQGISIRPTTSTMLSCVDTQTENGIRSHTIHASYGRTRSRSQRMDISMLRPTNCIARRVTRKGATCAASPTHSSASASTPSLSYCGNAMFRNTNYNSRTL
jgi:Major royal jelly protein